MRFKLDSGISYSSTFILSFERTWHGALRLLLRQMLVLQEQLLVFGLRIRLDKFEVVKRTLYQFQTWKARPAYTPCTFEEVSRRARILQEISFACLQ